MRIWVDFHYSDINSTKHNQRKNSFTVNTHLILQVKMKMEATHMIELLKDDFWLTDRHKNPPLKIQKKKCKNKIFCVYIQW